MIFKLKLASTEVNSKLLMLLHKKTGLSIPDIKSSCENLKPIYTCDSADTQGLTKLNMLNKEISNLGFETQVFIDNKQVDVEMFANIEKRNIQIDNASDY